MGGKWIVVTDLGTETIIEEFEDYEDAMGAFGLAESEVKLLHGVAYLAQVFKMTKG